ncbi:MAG: hypothetical protein RL637_1720 [Pseudomonadota bacterium]
MDNVRFILIVAFLTICYWLWQAWQIDYAPKPTISTTDAPVVAANHREENQVPVKAVNTVANPVIHVTTDKLDLEIDTEGGTIRRLDLLQYPTEKNNTAANWLRQLVGLDAKIANVQPIRLFNTDAEKTFLAQSGLIAEAGSMIAPDHHQHFQSQQTRYQLAENQQQLVVPLTWDNGQGLQISKILTFTRDSYGIQLTQQVVNRSAYAWTGRQYLQLMRTSYVDKSSNSFIRTYTGGVVYTEEDKYQKVSFEDMDKTALNTHSIGGWAAMIQHYFAAAWIPPVNQDNQFYSKQLGDNHYAIGTLSGVTTVPAHTEVKFNAQLFAGPKIQPLMEKYAKGLELTVDYGWLTLVGKPIYALLNILHNSVQNWGIAILGVTFCIKLLFFPLSQSSYRSMAKMRKVQPQLKALQEQFADDRPRFNTEMMDLYRREKVNPLGGCLPILVQIPVFISLYWVLIETVEIRQAPFLLWIQDLSAQDPFYLLPVLYGITMKIQQSLNPAPVDPVQAKVMQMFPVIFTVFFLFFPSGLVLYWICNNTLSIIQQWYITRSIENDPRLTH